VATFTLDDADKFADAIGEAITKAKVNGLLSAAMRGVQIIQTQIIPSRSPQPVDRAVYKGAWKVNPNTDGSVDIYNDAPHAVFIEDGVRNPRMGAKARAALAEWATRKGLVTGGATAQQVAWRIAKAIQRRGYIFGQSGLGIFRELLEKHMDALIEEEVTREVNRLVPK
jgi:hypothetical protein